MGIRGRASNALLLKIGLKILSRTQTQAEPMILLKNLLSLRTHKNLQKHMHTHTHTKKHVIKYKHTYTQIHVVVHLEPLALFPDRTLRLIYIQLEYIRHV